MSEREQESSREEAAQAGSIVARLWTGELVRLALCQQNHPMLERHHVSKCLAFRYAGEIKHLIMLPTLNQGPHPSVGYCGIHPSVGY